MSNPESALNGLDISKWPWDLQMEALHNPEIAWEKEIARKALLKRVRENQVTERSSFVQPSLTEVSDM